MRDLVSTNKGETERERERERNSYTQKQLELKKTIALLIPPNF